MGKSKDLGVHDARKVLERSEKPSAEEDGYPGLVSSHSYEQLHGSTVTQMNVWEVAELFQVLVIMQPATSISHGLTCIHPQKPTRTTWVQCCLMYSGRLWPTQTNMQPLPGPRKNSTLFNPHLICEKASRRTHKITPNPFQMMRAKAFWAAQNVCCCFCNPNQGSMSVWGRYILSHLSCAAPLKSFLINFTLKLILRALSL